jgi:hypothetical protein
LTGCEVDWIFWGEENKGRIVESDEVMVEVKKKGKSGFVFMCGSCVRSGVSLLWLWYHERIPENYANRGWRNRSFLIHYVFTVLGQAGSGPAFMYGPSPTQTRRSRVNCWAEIGPTPFRLSPAQLVGLAQSNPLNIIYYIL